MWFIHLLWYLGSLAVIAATLLSVLPGKSWWMRIWDFPRIQVLCVGLALLLAALLLYPEDSSLKIAWVVVMIMLSLSVIQQLRWAARMTPLMAPEVRGSEHSNSDGTRNGRVRVVAANVDYTNSKRQSAMEMLVESDADLMAIVEVDAQWDGLIESYSETYPYRVTEFREKGRGIALLSKLKFVEPEIQYLVEDERPSIWAKLHTHGAIIGVCVLHPPPPGLKKRSGDERVSSKPRDIELMIAAKRIADSTIEHWIMVGDFNDVGWSRTTEQAKQAGGLRDPRIGRGMYNTFPANRPLLRYPIDHVLVTDAFRVERLTRLENIGSDHLPLLAELWIDLSS